MLPYMKGLFAFAIGLWLIDAVIVAVKGDTGVMLICLVIAALLCIGFTQLGKLFDD